MLTLHGVAGRADTNALCAALYEKGAEFEHVPPHPDERAERRTRTPADEAPALETPAGSLTGISVILDYLEAIAPEPALLPADPFARAKVQELARGAAQILDSLNVPGLQAARYGAPLAADMKGPVHAQLDRAVATVLRLARFEPWFAGDTFSQADIVWHFSFDAGAQIAHGLYGRDLYAEIAPAAAHRDAMAARASVQRALALGER